MYGYAFVVLVIMMDTLGLVVLAGIVLYLLSQQSPFGNLVTETAPPESGTGITGTLSIPQIAAYASAAGFAGSDLITSVAVALAESGGDPSAMGDNNQSYGLWQIYAPKHPEFGPNFMALLDPQANAHAAFSVYSAAGSTFQPWTVYSVNGRYAQFMPQVEAALG